MDALAQNKTEEFAKILGNQTVAGAIVAYHVLPELVYKFGTLKALDRKFINTALSNAVSDTSGAFALQIDEEGGSIFIKGTGSEVKVIGADNYACNGIIHLVDGVLLPFDADGELSEKQKERLEDRQGNVIGSDRRRRRNGRRRASSGAGAGCGFIHRSLN